MTTSATKVLVGRRESELLAFPSVRRMADILTERCREESWLRTSVASLNRFRMLTGNFDLEALLTKSQLDVEVAESALLAFAHALDGYTAIQVAALAMGPKIWFRLNGVNIAWRPLPGASSSTGAAINEAPGLDRLVLLALIGSGLRLVELLRLRVGDVGSLDRNGYLIGDFEAEPLAVQHTPKRGKPVKRITFLTYQARQALLAHLQQRAVTGHSLKGEAPLLARVDGSPLTAENVARARQRSRALIRAGSEVNVTLCRTTGDFFREWGLPGSRFTGPEDLNLEDYV